MNEEIKFDFDFEGGDGGQLLDQAKQELLNLKGKMGTGQKDANDEEIRKTEEYFSALQSGKLQFTKADPIVFPLNRDHFKQNDLPVPKNFDVLCAQGRFYWLEMPLVLVPGEKPFYKLQVSMEFGEKSDKGRLVPTVHSAFPDSKSAEYARIEGKFDFGLSEDLKFKVAAGIKPVDLPSIIPIVKANAGGKLGVDAKLASNLGFAAGPFSHTLKCALVDCRFAGEQVLWTITDKQSWQENNPIFIVVLMVPTGVGQVHLKTYAQAHRIAPLPQFMVRMIDKIFPKGAEWLKKGCPVTLPPYSHLITTQ